MKIILSRISGAGDIEKEFIEKVDDDANFTSLPSGLSTLVQILKLTKAIMALVSKVVHLSSLNLIIVDGLIEVVRYTRY
jgi:hypothetical protein